jgi:hypothetical protein
VHLPRECVQPVTSLLQKTTLRNQPRSVRCSRCAHRQVHLGVCGCRELQHCLIMCKRTWLSSAMEPHGNRQTSVGHGSGTALAWHGNGLHLVCLSWLSDCWVPHFDATQLSSVRQIGSGRDTSCAHGALWNTSSGFSLPWCGWCPLSSSSPWRPTIQFCQAAQAAFRMVQVGRWTSQIYI